ncbi:MAG: hypothetical protein QMC91_00825 [Methanoculleus sp.]|jgi:hypothetical protein|nr:hypothetical protein [Methanoculleus sp.]
MADNPYDEMFRKIERLMERILSDLPDYDPKIIGFTIISGPTGEGIYPYFSDDNYDDPEVEVIEGDDCIYITTVANALADGAPYVTFHKKSVTLCTGGAKEMIVDLNWEIDLVHSSYNVQHGVIDVVCRKKNIPGETSLS